MSDGGSGAAAKRQGEKGQDGMDEWRMRERERETGRGERRRRGRKYGGMESKSTRQRGRSRENA